MKGEDSVRWELDGRRRGAGGKAAVHTSDPPAIRREDGAILVLFSVVLPLILLVGVISVDVGNWFVHQKRLQTLVDAAAFAGGMEFTGCFQNATTTNAAIFAKALEYAGDTARDPTTRNQQEQTPAKTRVVLNSSRYWDSSTETIGTTALDNTWTTPPTPGDPCSTRALDVKATDDVVPLLFGFIPVAASPHAHARVEIRRVIKQTGMLPWAVPEVDPRVVAAIFVDEETGAVMATLQLNKQTLPTNDPLSGWGVWRGGLMDFQLNSDHVGVVILTSKSASPSLSGTLSQICGQNPVQTRCYAGSTPMSGLSFIHGYSGQNGTPAAPVPKQVELDNLTCPDLSAPYFVLSGGCALRVRAVIDFGAGTADPTQAPTCALVTSSLGEAMTWSPGGLGGTLGTWTSSSFTVAADSGRNAVHLSWWSGPRATGECGNQNQHPNGGTMNTVAAPYVSNTASGPVEYLQILSLTPPPSRLANSLDKGAGKNFEVTVGLTPPLSVAHSTDPPIYLRITTNSSQTQAVDCDRNENFEREIENGCLTPYAVNERGGDCSNYVSGGDLPPQTTNPDPVPDCVITQTGVSGGQLRHAIQQRFGTPCTANNWPTSDTAPLPDESDPRWVTLFIVDTGSFQSSGNDIYPIRKFGGFYLTGADGLNCPGDDPPPPNGRQASVWGHFVTYVFPDPNAGASEQLCDFSQVGTCRAILVE